MLNGHTPHVPEDVRQLNYAKKLQAMPWPTTVDWDGRAKYESDKEAMAQPVMQHYLKRMKPWMYK
jgi:lipopolysaccharide biosynthesis glycosyltransferase